MKFDASDLTNGLDDDVEKTEQMLLDLTVKTTLDVEAALKLATPRKTGRAANGWVSTLPTTPFQSGVVENNVEYLEILNTGTSKQAAPLFIESTVARYNGGQ